MQREVCGKPFGEVLMIELVNHKTKCNPRRRFGDAHAWQRANDALDAVYESLMFLPCHMEVWREEQEMKKAVEAADADRQSGRRRLFSEVFGQ
jgi:hypothetical protein